MNLNQLYRPITATPFTEDETYMEFEPCDALKPYIRCFWGTKKPYTRSVAEEAKKSLIVPDTCMDIIFDVNYTENTVCDKFCGINDQSFTVSEDHGKGQCISTFAIRFYAWTAVLFSEEAMSGVKNAFFDAGYHFSRLKDQLEPLLFDLTDIHSRAMAAERFLLRLLHPERENRLVMEGIYEILRQKGSLKAGELGKTLHVSTRQLERLFKENIGISPKKMSSLIRFQYLWSDVVYQRDFQIQDEIYKFGYTDQSHLLKDFKRFHTMTLKEAKQHALKEVAFLQEPVEKKM